jgi:hypothetical protein
MSVERTNYLLCFFVVRSSQVCLDLNTDETISHDPNKSEPLQTKLKHLMDPSSDTVFEKQVTLNPFCKKTDPIFLIIPYVDTW